LGKHTYGLLPSDFWESGIGRSIQAAGKDPLILSAYLRANKHDTMIGLYRLRLGEIQLEVPTLGSLETIRHGLQLLTHVGFADYDDAASCVWVREMARERLNLEAGCVLDPEDKRCKGAQRLYELLPPSWLLTPFFDAYGRTLRLRRRTIAQPTLLDVPPHGVTPHDVPPVPPLDDAAQVVPAHVARPGDQRAIQAPCKPLASPFEGASASGTGTSVPVFPDQVCDQDDQVLRSARTAADTPRLPALLGSSPRHRDLASAPNGTNYGVIAKAARELLADGDLAAKYLGGIPLETLEDLIEATKSFCARRKIDIGRRDPVPFDIVGRACTSEWLKFHRPDITGGAAPRARDLRRSR
jgi:hypothetical protein